MGFGTLHLHAAIHTCPAVGTIQGQHSQLGTDCLRCGNRGTRMQAGGQAIVMGQQPVLSLDPISCHCRSRVSLHNMVRVKYLSGCLKENQAGGGEKVHKHGQEAACPWLPLGQWPWPPRAPSWLPGGPWQVQASLPGGPQCPSVLVYCRGNQGTQGQHCCWQTACPQRARPQGPQTLGQKPVPAGALRQHQELG